MIMHILDKIVRPALVALTVVLMATFAIAVAAPQNGQEQKSPASVDQDGTGRDASRPFTELEEEMRAKRAIKFADKEYQENLERARDLSSLSASIVASFKQKHELDQENLKKLEKVEKLAKSIRSAAGGSEDEVEMKKPPTNLRAAVDMLDDLSKSLKDKVEKTPKHVISAAVIDEANVLLELIRIVRTLPAKV
jgi:predicted transcriptional regulator